MTPNQTDLPDRHKRVEEALRSSEDRYRTLFDRAHDGIAIPSPDGKLLDVNESFARMHGYSTKEMPQMSLKDLVTPETAILVPERMGRLLAGEVLTFEVEHYHKDGQIFPLEVSASLILIDGESFIQCFHRDITKRKLAEKVTASLENQLRQAMKMEAVGRLTGGVLHDFNNILMVIIGYSDLLLEKAGKKSPLQGELEEIRLAGERAALITQQLLAFSRKQVLEPKVAHLDDLVTEMKKMLTRMIGENIAIQINTCPSLGLVKVDPGQFQQILMNLVLNSRDSMPNGGDLLIETANVNLDEGYCVLHPYMKPGRFVMLSVSDTGMGMSEEVRSHVFEPFFTTKETGRGTGLGLATTYAAVKQAGGYIEVDSEVGIGTTMKIYLPCVGASEKCVKDDPPGNSPGGTETVLLVEDENILRQLCVVILEPLGYKVMPARNGTEAITVAQKYSGRIDLLLTDVVMPGMNGRELATQLVLQHPEAKVLFMSGHTENVIFHDGVLDEGVFFIRKPHSPSALAKKVREVLDME